MTTETVTAASLQIATIDDMLRQIRIVRLGNHRDPLRALEDRLLDLREAVAGE